MIVQKVLVADDDFDDIELLKEVISEYSADIEISYVTDGVELMDKLEKDLLPDVLILDLNMPCKEGRACLSEIRLNEQWKDLIIIVYSTTDVPDIKNECLSLGANHFVTKPSQMIDLMKFAESLTKGTFDFV